MVTIVINDLPESTELDRKAMLAITGGARFRAGANVSGGAAIARMRLFELSPSHHRDELPSSATQPQGALKCHP
jgi:hypothetical protein